MAFYQIGPERATLHGTFSRELPPCLTVTSGDTVRFRTLEANWSLAQRTMPVWPGDAPEFEPRDAVTDNGHALCGPVFIQGAQPGMTLEVKIGEIVPGPWGYAYGGGWSSPLNERLGLDQEAGAIHLWTLDAGTMKGYNQHAHQVLLRPFLGVMGMPENIPGPQPTFPPRVTGGNMDCKELVSGSSLFLPIAVPGGLFSVGDGHAVQGDGEVSGVAIECPIERVDLTFLLHPEWHLTTPCANTPAGWLTMGFDEDLNEAMVFALDSMMDLMGERQGLSRQDALALASLVVDLRITQVVNGVKGVHALLPHGALMMPNS